MPKLQLTQQFADNPPIVKHKPKTDYFDTVLTGFFLEVRASGKATYYQRYRDRHRKNRQERHLTKEETSRLLAVLKDWPNRAMAESRPGYRM